MPCLAPPGPSSQFVCTCSACRRATYAPGVTEWPDRLSRCQSPVRLTGPRYGLGTCSVLSNSTRVTPRMLLPNVCSVVDPGDQVQGAGQGASGRQGASRRQVASGRQGGLGPTACLRPAPEASGLFERRVSRRGSAYLGVVRRKSAWIGLPRRGLACVAWFGQRGVPQAENSSRSHHEEVGTPRNPAVLVPQLQRSRYRPAQLHLR